MVEFFLKTALKFRIALKICKKSQNTLFTEAGKLLSGLYSRAYSDGFNK